MAANKSHRDLIADLISCDEQPSEERLAEVHKTLQRKVASMNRRARQSRNIWIVAFLLFASGYALVAISAQYQPEIRAITLIGTFLLIAGAILAIVGSIGLLLYSGFGYVWARHDLNDAAIMELTLQVQKLSQQLEAQNKKA